MSECNKTHLIIGGGLRPDGYGKFTVEYKGLVFEFYERRVEGSSVITHTMDVDFSDEEFSMIFTLLLTAGYHPDVKENTVKWFRPLDRILWSEERSKGLSA